MWRNWTNKGLCNLPSSDTSSMYPSSSLKLGSSSSKPSVFELLLSFWTILSDSFFFAILMEPLTKCLKKLLLKDQVWAPRENGYNISGNISSSIIVIITVDSLIKIYGCICFLVQLKTQWFHKCEQLLVLVEKKFNDEWWWSLVVLTPWTLCAHVYWSQTMVFGWGVLRGGENMWQWHSRMPLGNYSYKSQQTKYYAKCTCMI